MNAGTTHDTLLRLRDVILRERECAKVLDMKSLTAAMQEKEELVKVLANTAKLEENDKAIAAEIRQENRRNAYLYKATLDWIRETMEFFGKRTITTGYSKNGGLTSTGVNGRLLSGQV